MLHHYPLFSLWGDARDTIDAVWPPSYRQPALDPARSWRRHEVSPARRGFVRMMD